MRPELEQLKAKADVYQSELHEALKILDHPDISADLDRITEQIAGFRALVAGTLNALEYPELSAEVSRLKSQAEGYRRDLEQSLASLGYVDLVSKLETAERRLNAYRAAAFQCLSDFDQLHTSHASDYALRRKTELKKRLEEIDVTT